MYNFQINNISFNARMVFKKPKVEVKPYVVNNVLMSDSKRTSALKNPSWFTKLLFGIKKQIKLPSES